MGGLALFLVFGDKPWDHSKDIATRLAAGKQPSLKHDVAAGLYRAAALNLALCAALLASLRLWTRPLRPRPENGQPTSGSHKWFLLLLAVAVVLGGTVRWNLAHRSLWWDELWNARQTIHGSYKAGESGEQEFRPGSFQRALWYYKKPTNHVPFAVSSRLCLQTWQLATGRQAAEFDEFVLRLPSYLAALAAIAGIGILLRLWGMPRAGVLAAFLLAIHPWHIRYGIDGRSYSLIVLFTILAALSLTLALQRRQWCHWLAFGLCQFLLVWSNPLLAFLAAGFTGGALLHILLTFDNDERWAGVSRLLVVNIFAAMLFFQVMGPNLLQAQRWDMAPGAFTPLNRENLVDYLSQQSFGYPYQYPRTLEAEGLPTLTQRTAGNTWAQPALSLLTAALFLAGLAVLQRRNRAAFMVTASIVAASALYLLFASQVESFYFYPRFLSYGLIPYLVCVSVGICALGERINPRWGPCSVLLITVAAAAIFVLPQIRMLRNRPYEPYRDLVSFIREQAPESISVIYGHGGEPVDLYDPDMHFVTESSEIAELCEESQRTGLPLYLCYGHASYNRSRLPGAFTLIDNPDCFEPIRDFPGIEPDFYYRMFRYTGMPLSNPGP